MLLSMTGFGKSVVEAGNKKFTVEVKSLNSKQLDMSLRVPAMLREVELELRNRIGRRLERGKIEAAIYVESSDPESMVQFNLQAIAAYKAQIENVSNALSIPLPTDWYGLLTRLPEALHTENQQTLDEDDLSQLYMAVDEAVEALMQFRATEGQKLEDFFSVRISNIENLLAEVPRYEGERIAKIRSRIEENLSKVAIADYDRGRLEQEMIFYIEKLDVNEEKQRLTQHLNYFVETMDGNYGQGKKLGFICQEMGREINTLGSKSNQADMQKLVVRMKDELEQIKEQVLNVM